MEYDRRSINDPIRASLAFRLGKVLESYYKNLSEKDDEYEVTLTLAILQTLLTNCIELLNRTKKKAVSFLDTKIGDNNIFDINSSAIIKNTFFEPNLNIEGVIRHIRNSLSHPTDFNLSDTYIKTGYTTDKSEGVINYIVFVHSPDLDKYGVPNSYREKRLLERVLNRRNSNYPKDVTIGTNRSNKFILKRHNESYYKTFQIKLTPKQLANLAYAIAEFLSKSSDINKNSNLITKLLIPA